MRQTRKRQRGGSNYKLENVLGVTAAVGYNKEVLPQATALSTNTRSNYLTLTLKNKKFKNYFKGIPPEDWLWHAVKKYDLYAVKRLLNNSLPGFKKEFTQREYKHKGFTGTPFHHVIHWLTSAPNASSSWASKEEKLVEIALELVPYNDSNISNEDDSLFFYLDLPLSILKKLLDRNPRMKSQFVETIEEIINETLEANAVLQERINQSQNKNGPDGEIGRVKQILRGQMRFIEEYMDILRTIDPDTYNNYSNALRRMFGNENV